MKSLLILSMFVGIQGFLLPRELLPLEPTKYLKTHLQSIKIPKFKVLEPYRRSLELQKEFDMAREKINRWKMLSCKSEDFSQLILSPLFTPCAWLKMKLNL